MDQKILAFLLCFGCLATCTNAQFTNCDVTRSLTYVGQWVNLDHTTSVASCRYLITSPPDTYIQASCSISTTCTRNVFSISRAGEKDLSDALTYCGKGTPPVATSIGNEIVVALNNGIYAPGSFQCTFTVVAPSNTNCDCGWSLNTKIVGGTHTAVNEFVSHGGLVDVLSKEIYCGAVISKRA
jgi:hypothetical protein